jgi:hypothetical protein
MMEDLFFFSCMKSNKIPQEIKSEIEAAYQADDLEYILYVLQEINIHPTDIIIPTI